LGAPFIADASPTISASGIPSTVLGGTDVTVSGLVTNPEPGYPPVAGAPVTVDELLGGLPVPVGSGTTNPSGGYSITFEPTSSGSYEVTTGTISQIENAALSPPFGDQLSPAASPAITASVQAGISISSAKPSPGLVTVAGKLAPGAPDANATVTLLYRSQGSKGGFTQFGGTSLPTGATSYGVAGPLPAGKWQVEAEYRDPGLLVGATSSAVNVSVTSLKGAHTVSFKKVKVKKGKVTASGTLKPAPTSSGAKVELLAMKSGSVRFRAVAKTSVRKGKTTFAIKTKLGRGSRWYLQLEYVQKGETTTYSKLTSVQVR
jgi:hypothetical protein